MITPLGWEGGDQEIDTATESSKIEGLKVEEFPKDTFNPSTRPGSVCVCVCV